jgi:hypothetical protein
MSILFTDSTEWWIEISEEQKRNVQTDQHLYSTAKANWNAYLNQLCLQVIQPWLTQTYPSQPIDWTDSDWTDSHGTDPHRRDSSTLWEFINGTAFTIGQKRVILLLAEAIDASYLEIQQEWIDLPNLVGDYYLFVQIHSDTDSNTDSDTDRPNWLHILGYSSHREIKAKATYEMGDRTYLLNADDITPDLNTLWLTLSYCPTAVTRSAVAPLPTVPETQLEQLVDRLTRISTVPRLALPFELWGAILNQPEWRDRLYRQRVEPDQASIRVQLSNWLNRAWEQQLGWRSLNQLISEGFAGMEPAFSLRSSSQVESTDAEIDPETNEQVQGKLVEWNRLDEPAVLMLVGVTREPDQRLAVKVQVHPHQDQHYVPANLNLLLLSENGTVLQTVESGERDNFIQLRKFRCSTGTQFSLQLVLADEISIETFVV